MIHEEEKSKKEVIINVLQEAIVHIKESNEEEILERKTKFNTEEGTGYYVSNNRIHLWLVNFSKTRR